MSSNSLSAPEQRAIAQALIQDRFGTSQMDISLVEPFVNFLLEFEPGEVAPAQSFYSVDGVGLAAPQIDLALNDLRGEQSLRPWPDDAPMAIAVTHDVDLFDGLSLFGLRVASWAASTMTAVAKAQLARATEIVTRGLQWTRWWINNHDPIADIAHWQALEAEHGIRSTFFFLSLAKALSKEGRLYRVSDPKVKRVLRSLRDGGWEVGLHAARYESSDALGLERQRIRLENAAGCRVQSVRYHYLTARFPQAWSDMHDAGFTVSSNVGFHPPHQGFRTATSWPYRPLAHKRSNLYEMPMALMDLAHGPARPRLVEFFDQLCTKVREAKGLLVINFHTNYRADIDAPGVHTQFIEILGRIQNMVNRGEATTVTLIQAAQHLSQHSE